MERSFVLACAPVPERGQSKRIIPFASKIFFAAALSSKSSVLASAMTSPFFPLAAIALALSMSAFALGRDEIINFACLPSSPADLATLPPALANLF